jgi:Uma2 family endonuclease
VIAMALRRLNMTVDEYLELEANSSTRHEFVDGQIFDMVGASEAHNFIAGNVYSILRAHVRGSACRAFVSDFKVRIAASNSFYYPDVVVTCEPPNPSRLFTTVPVLIVEVRSPSTAATDKREKLTAYRQIKTLQEYLIIYQDKQLIELYRKEADERWAFMQVQAGEELLLKSIPCGELGISMDAVYEDVVLGSADELR